MFDRVIDVKRVLYYLGVKKAYLVAHVSGTIATLFFTTIASRPQTKSSLKACVHWSKMTTITLNIDHDKRGRWEHNP